VLINKTVTGIEVALKMEDDRAELVVIGDKDFMAPPGEQSKGTIMVVFPTDQVNSNLFTLSIGVYVDGEKIKTFEAGFVAPVTN